MLQSFPSLTRAEFYSACEALEQRGFDRLTGTDWLGVKWTGETLLIKQKRKVEEARLASTKIEIGERITEEFDDEDTAIVQRTEIEQIIIDFSVTWSPTYQVPVLWFSYHEDPASRLQSVERVHELLVPGMLKSTLRDMGVIGGISIAHHPVTDLQEFFIHPCNTHAAMEASTSNANISAEEYLILWIGVVGSSIGLHVPSKLLVPNPSAK